LTAVTNVASGRQWKTFLLVSASSCLAGVYACSAAIANNENNKLHKHAHEVNCKLHKIALLASFYNLRSGKYMKAS
jgi:hypothetical protein